MKILIEDSVLRQAIDLLTLARDYGPAMAHGNVTINDGIDALIAALDAAVAEGEKK